MVFTGVPGTTYSVPCTRYQGAVTVSELTKQLKQLIEVNYHSVWVQGEVSNFSTPSSGHWYFTLKDHQAQILGVMFKGQNRKLKFAPEDGLEVLCHGFVSVYEPRGTYQLIIDSMEPLGQGALQLAFQQLKERLEKDGLFAPEHKKPIPFLPQKIAVITSPTGAAIRDILKVLYRRHSGLQISILPVPVQGDQAAPSIVEAIEFANSLSYFDVILLARGGGSLEDLWSFNEEIVARAIFSSSIPIVSAVGHEIDFTITDFVADLRAPTPSAAAEMIVKSKLELLRQVEDLRHRMVQNISKTLTLCREKTFHIGKRLIDPRQRLSALKIRFDEFYARLTFILKNSISQKRLQTETCSQLLQPSLLKKHHRVKEQFSGLVGKLESLSPLSVLKRGYSYVTKLGETTLLTSTEEAEVGEKIDVHLAKGSLECEIVTIHSS